MSEIQVSICVITFNHEKYIRQCIESILNQVVNFDFEILIYDDASTDKTPDIIKEIQLKYPLIIKPILNSKNIYSSGFRPINRFNFERAKGKYIALCEGDDFWCSISKLQMQVDKLEMHIDNNICFTNFCIVNSDGQILNNRVLKFKKYSFHYLELYYRNFIPNLTVLFRNTNELAHLDLTGYYPPDWYLHLFNNGYSKIVYIDEVTSSYRVHQGGICSSRSPIENDNMYLTSLINYISSVSKFKIKIIILFAICRIYIHRVYHQLLK